jgi:hypothetical protein
MYLLSLAYQNSRLNDSGQFEVRRTDASISKWTVLDADDRNLELLRLMVVSCNSPQYLEHIPFPFKTFK